MRTLLFLITIFISIACDQSDSIEKNVFFDGKKAHWITDSKPLPTHDSLFYLEHPAPLFRKEFNLSAAITEAKLYITAAGYYTAFINGQRIGKNLLDPAWTDYSKRIYYTEYDITSQLKEGQNCLGVTLGNGFYNPLPLKKWGRRNLREDTKVGKPVFICKLKITYSDGSEAEIVSDPTWKYNDGPLLKNSVYLGVLYDANKEIKHWNQSEYDDQVWENAVIGTSPRGKLQASFFPPVRNTQEIFPEKIYSNGTGIWIVDMGENFTGTYNVKISGFQGDTITFRFGERIYEDGSLNPMTSVIGQIKRKGVGGPGAPEIAWQTDQFIIGPQSDQWFTPEFTYHTFRYMEIKGLDKAPQLEDIKGLSLHSDVMDTNHFSCSNELLNDIQSSVERTFLANLVSVQSDCPAREKFGYGGDINATSESFIYNYDMRNFYRKTVYDWIDAMSDTCFVDTAPFVGIKYCGISWESAYLITQYNLYLYYNDLEFIKELYPMNLEWMEKAARIHPSGIVEQGLSDHESLEPVPVQLTGTSHYLQCARIMTKFAELMGDQPNQEKFATLSEMLKDSIRKEYWDRPVEEKINRQTLFATLLYHRIIPPDEIEKATDSLIVAVKNGPSSHFNTGIFGTKYILYALSKYASPEMVYQVVNSTEFPGWGHMIDRGATTLWETWKESDNTYSNNHPMFGSVTEWFYQYLGGIQIDPEHPGFKAFILAPSTPAGLDSVSCNYYSIYGNIKSEWNKNQDGSYTFQFTIPDSTEAKVILPTGENQIIDIQKKDETNYIIESNQFELEGGQYFIKVN